MPQTGKPMQHQRLRASCHRESKLTAQNTSAETQREFYLICSGQPDPLVQIMYAQLFSVVKRFT